MAAHEVVVLNETKAATPGAQALEAPQVGDTYSMPRPLAITGVAGTAALSITGGTQTTDVNFLNLTGTWNNAAVTFTGIKVNITSTAANANSVGLDLQLAGSTAVSLSQYGSVVVTDKGYSKYSFISSGTSFAFRADGAATAITSGGVKYGSANYLAWSSTANWYDTLDLYIYRDAANTLALRNSTNAQTFNIYNTYTDGSNYERGFMRWNSNVFEIGYAAAGTGNTGRQTKLISPGNIYVYSNTNLCQTWFTDGSTSFPKETYHTKFAEFTEQTAPSAGSANTVRIYAVDNGAGKTQLMALFATGAAQQIAIEP